MEVLEVQLRVLGYPALDELTRTRLTAGDWFPALPHSWEAQIWKTAMTGRIRLAVQVQESAVSLTDDWMVSIYGHRLINCVGAMFHLVSAIVAALGAPVTFELLNPISETGIPLRRQLRRAARRRVALTAAKWILPILAGAGLGALIQWLIWGGL